MTSEVEICNLALSHIRATSINSLTEQSLQAQQCKLLYPIMRDQVIEDAPWQFAHVVEALAVLSSVDIFNWNYAYQYPSNCLKINRLMLNWEEVQNDQAIYAARLRDLGLTFPDLKQQVEYSIYNVDGNRVIAANECELRVDYVKKVTDPNLFSTQFVMALSHLLGAELAVPIVGVDKGRALRSDSLKMYNAYIESAAAANQNEQYSHTPDSEYISIRG
jgi:hypothetical protein|tara:strand:- start:16467 stop:17123 length:657 start_codon:yes stop_codon:yes gene_type:complete